jgi:hypothetical protein
MFILEAIISSLLIIVYRIVVKSLGKKASPNRSKKALGRRAETRQILASTVLFSILNIFETCFHFHIF